MGIEISKLWTDKCVTAREKESIVTKRVPFGELIFFAEFPPTTGLTPDAESESSRRFVFSACHATTCDKPPDGRILWPFRAERHLAAPWPFFCLKLSPSLVNRANRVNNLVQFGPRKQPFPESGGRKIQDRASGLVQRRPDTMQPTMFTEPAPRPRSFLDGFETAKLQVLVDVRQDGRCERKPLVKLTPHH